MIRQSFGKRILKARKASASGIASGQPRRRGGIRKDRRAAQLRDLSGFKDDFLAAVLEGLRGELSSGYQASSLFLEGIAQSLAVHLIRNYTAGRRAIQEYKGGLSGFSRCAKSGI